MANPLFIAFSGPQGSGKTTLMNSVYEQLLADEVKVYLDTFKVSRAVQTQLGWNSLANVLESYDTMNQFQELVSVRKNAVITKMTADLATTDILDVDVVLTERSHADIMAYYYLWAAKLGYTNDLPNPRWIVQAALYQIGNYRHNIYVPFMDHIKFEYDEHRGFEADITEYGVMLREILQTYCAKNTFYVTGKSVEDRTVEVSNFIKGCLNGNS